jgi:hypothetical protein
MANLNLSEFTEKTFVADADWTFVWDTAGAISKKVSRNSLLNSGTLAGASAPITVSQTWNDAAVAFTALKVNAISTASAASSLLLDLQVGGTSRFYVNKAGAVSAFNYNGLNGIGLGTMQIASSAASYGYHMARDYCVTWGGNTTLDGSIEVSLCRDAANTLALRNGTNAQTFNVYGTYTSGTSYERLTLSAPTSANAIIGTNKGGSGGTARGLEIQTDGVTRLSFNADGTLATLSATNFITGTQLRVGNGTRITNSSDGVLKISSSAENDFNRLQFGGTSASFPAIKRSTTYLQARLADDSAFAPIQGKLTTDTAFTSGAITDTGYIVLYDSTGTAYKVACTPV